MRADECVERKREHKKQGEEARGIERKREAARGSERKRQDKMHPTHPNHCTASNAVKRVGACVGGAIGSHHQCQLQATATRLLLQSHTTYTPYSYTGACVGGGRLPNTLPNTLPNRLVERKTSEQEESTRARAARKCEVATARTLRRARARGGERVEDRGKRGSEGRERKRGRRREGSRSARHGPAALALTGAAYNWLRASCVSL